MEKQGIVTELKELLAQWELLQANKDATLEQFTLLQNKIAILCDKLDVLGKLS